MTKARDLASGAPAPAGVSSTELGYVDGVTSAIQTQLNAKAVYPSQTGNSGKFLTTDGTTTSWGAVADSGLTLITSSTFTGSTGPSVNNCFSSTYRNYKIIINLDSASVSNSNMAIRMRLSGTDATGANYYTWGFEPNSGSSTIYNAQQNGGTVGPISYQGESGTHVAIEMFNPALAQKTNWTTAYASSTPVYGLIGGTFAGTHNVATAYDGFTIIPNGAGATVTGTIRVYGYKN